ncbi:MAG: hypothetical protein H6744_05385 [Deltaproteobacteria bacterium]|nr:hypothetical protein [Deltaproteobacteria bacterium]MCB9786111.1 hypothetical protein [Deltaproteobacteria bacterium]
MIGSGKRLAATYHVLVVGSDLGGLMYAALAARAGYRVGVVGHGARPNVYRHQGHLFLREAERFYGFSTSPVVNQVFGELSLGMEMKNRPRTLDPTLQLVLPDRRIDVTRAPDRWRRELDREMSDAGETMLSYEQWAQDCTAASDQALRADLVLPPTGLGANQRFRRAFAPCLDFIEGRAGMDPLFRGQDGGVSRALVHGAVGHLVTLTPRPLPPLATARLWTHVRAGLQRVPGGLDGLRDLFIAKIKEQCGDHRPDAVVERVVMRRGRATEVVLADRGERLGCALLVANTDPRRFAHLIPAAMRRDGFHGDLSSQEPVAWRLTVNLAVDPAILPAGMGSEVLLIRDGRAPLEGGNSLWITRPTVGPAIVGDGRPGPGVLTVTTVVPARGIAPGPLLVRRAVAEVLEGLRALIPWLDERLLTVHTPALTLDPRSGVEDVDVSAMQPVMGRALDLTADLSAVAVETPYPNILLTGSALFGGLGFEGTCLAAVQTLRATQRLLRLRTLRPGIGG